jgi:hypothetical protein
MSREGEEMRPEFYLDWHDIVNNPGRARMHLYPGMDKTVPYETKLRRMQSWVTAIQAYDSIMTDVGKYLPQQEAEDMINGGALPRLKRIVLETGTEGLIKLFTSLKFPVEPQKPNPFIPTWETLVNKAVSGEILNTWISQKGK